MISGEMVHEDGEICEIERIGVKRQGFLATEGIEDVEMRHFFEKGIGGEGFCGRIRGKRYGVF